MTPAYSPERDPGLERWDRLAQGLRSGGVEGFVEAYGTPNVPEKWHETINRVLHQRLSAHEHPEALADAHQRRPALAPVRGLGRPGRDRGARRSSSPAATRSTPSTRSRSASATREAIPGARLVSEDEGASPLAWQGAQVSKVIAEVADSAAAAP